MDELRSLVIAVKKILQDLSAYEDVVAMTFKMMDDEAFDNFTSTMDGVVDQATKLLAIRTWNPLPTLGGIVNPLYCEYLKTLV